MLRLPARRVRRSRSFDLLVEVVIVLTTTLVVAKGSPTGGKVGRTRPYNPQLPSGLRPEPSHDLPVMKLIEPANKVYDPQPENLDIGSLLEQMGSSFDPDFMSIKRPKESNQQAANGSDPGHVAMSFKRNKRGRLVPVGKMPKEIRRLRFRFLELPDGRKLPMHVGKKMRRKFKQLLWAYTYCPVIYRWKDLGVRFWPRWIREGTCQTGTSCSFPRGMSCKPRRSVDKVVLRWHCKNWDQKELCRWIPVRYPILTECTCGC